jgi:hypothetical protein
MTEMKRGEDDVPIREGIMNRLLACIVTCTAAVGLSIILSSCDKAKSPEPTTNPSAAGVAAPSSSIKPHPADVPAEAGKSGPGDGSTAIGGMVGGQEKGGANTTNPPGAAPAATGGDAASGHNQ